MSKVMKNFHASSQKKINSRAGPKGITYVRLRPSETFNMPMGKEYSLNGELRNRCKFCTY